MTREPLNYNIWYKGKPNNYKKIEHFTALWPASGERKWDDDVNESKYIYAKCIRGIFLKWSFDESDFQRICVNIFLYSSNAFCIYMLACLQYMGLDYPGKPRTAQKNTK